MKSYEEFEEEENSFSDRLLKEVSHHVLEKLKSVKVIYCDYVGTITKSTYLDLLSSVYIQILAYLSFRDPSKMGFGLVSTTIKPDFSVEMKLKVLEIIGAGTVYAFMSDSYDIVTLYNKPVNDYFEIILTNKNGKIKAEIDPYKYPSWVIAEKNIIDNIFTEAINKIIKGGL